MSARIQSTTPLQQGPLSELEAKFSTKDSALLTFPQRLRRCFMTGKQCIYCSYVETAEGNRARRADYGQDVFVVMPFRPNLDAFYDWSLTRYVEAGLNLSKSRIRRADQYRNIGYVMCEKICRRIQDAVLVIVDLSVLNPNVFYELGLAIGLNKPLLLVCDARRAQSYTGEFWQSIGITVTAPHANRIPDNIVPYPNVGFLSTDTFDLVKHVVRIPLQALRPEMKVHVLLVPDPPIEDEYFDIILTTNWDNLLDRSLEKSEKLRNRENYRIYVRGVDDEKYIMRHFQNPVPKIKIIKLQGEFVSHKIYVTPEETSSFSQPFADFLGEVFRHRDLLMVGYSFLDLCIQRCFSKNSNMLIYVNPNLPKRTDELQFLSLFEHGFNKPKEPTRRNFS